MKVMFEQKIGSWARTYHRNHVICFHITSSPDVDKVGLLMSVGRNVGDKAWFSSIDGAIGSGTICGASSSWVRSRHDNLCVPLGNSLQFGEGEGCGEFAHPVEIK